MDTGRAPTGQALAVPATPADAVDGPSGFDPSRLEGLAARCSIEGGPDRELDLLIFHAVSPGLGCSWEEFSDGMVFEKNSWCHRYTSSIDSALTLLAPHTLWAVADMEDGPIARLCWPMPNGGYTGGYVEGFGETAPLALCSAALNAIATEARRAATTGAVHEGAAPQGDRPNTGTPQSDERIGE